MNALPINIDDILSGKAVEWERIEFKAGWNLFLTLHTICAFTNGLRERRIGKSLVCGNRLREK